MIGPKRTPLTKAEEYDAYELVTLRDRKTCQRCGYQGHVERDHRQGRDKFNTTPANLQLLCGPFSPERCHKWKTEHPADAYAQGWTVPRGKDPAEWPGRRRIGDRLSWVLYDNDGKWSEITEREAWQRMGLEVPF